MMNNFTCNIPLYKDIILELTNLFLKRGESKTWILTLDLVTVINRLVHYIHVLAFA